MLLGLANVGPLRQQVRRQAGRHGGQVGRVAQSLAGAQAGEHVRWQGLAQQQHQGVLVQGALALLLRQRGARSLGQRDGLAVVQLGRHARVETQLGQLDRLFTGLQRVARNLQQLLVGQQRIPAAGHGGHQAGLRGAASFLGRQVLGQGGFLQAADAAEEVQLPRGDGQADLVAVDVLGARARGVRGAAGVDACTDRRELVGARDPVLGLGALDVERGHAQVTVVVQRGANQLLQACVLEEILPGQLRCSRAAFRRSGGVRAGVLRRDRSGRALVGGDERASRQEHGGGDGHRGTAINHGSRPPCRPVWTAGCAF